MPNISVIIPTRSRPHLLPQVVENAQRAGTDVEVIVVDDASVDRTAEVCRGLRGIKYVRLDRNQGVAGARNVGILASTAPFIAFIDDDDLRLPGTLDLQIEALEADPQAGFVCGQTLFADQDYRVVRRILAPQTSGDVFWDVLELNFPILPVSVVIRKECLMRVGLLRGRLSGIDDWDMWARLSELFPVAVVDRPVGIYRLPTPHSKQGSSNLGALLLRAIRHQPELLRLPRAQAAPAARRREARRRLRRRIADTVSWRAATVLPEGAYRAALKEFLVAVWIGPRWAVRPAHLKQMRRSFLAQRARKSGAGVTERDVRLIIKQINESGTS